MKIFRDPIHNVIDLDTGDKKTNELILNLIDTRDFQRLRFIKQLGLASYAYPSANHSRFEHSLGVAYLAKRIIDKLISTETEVLAKYELDDEKQKISEFFSRLKKDRCITIIAALLHDVGHGAFSHVSENLIDIKHESWVREMILDESTNINALLRAEDPNYPRLVWDILSPNDAQNPMPTSKLISGQLDIDKIDYLLRDAHMTGSGYGKFDIEWLINVLTVGIYDDSVEIGLDLNKGLSVAEAFVMSRINMFKNVYLHKVSIIAQATLRLIFKRLKETGENLEVTAINNIYLSNDITRENMKHYLGDYISVTDVDFYYSLKTIEAKSKDDIVKKLCANLLYRNFFKQVTKEELYNLKEHMKTKDEKEFYTLVLDIRDKSSGLMYKPDKDQIFLFDKSGVGYDLAEKSAIINTSKVSENYEPYYFVDRDIYSEST